MSRFWIDHEEATIESFRRDKEYAAEYLRSVLADGDEDEILLAERRISIACPELMRAKIKTIPRQPHSSTGVYAS